MIPIIFVLLTSCFCSEYPIGRRLEARASTMDTATIQKMRRAMDQQLQMIQDARGEIPQSLHEDIIDSENVLALREANRASKSFNDCVKILNNYTRLEYFNSGDLNAVKAVAKNFCKF